jgi:hypothetical protein
VEDVGIATLHLASRQAGPLEPLDRLHVPGGHREEGERHVDAIGVARRADPDLGADDPSRSARHLARDLGGDAIGALGLGPIDSALGPILRLRVLRAWRHSSLEPVENGPACFRSCAGAGAAERRTKGGRI